MVLEGEPPGVLLEDPTERASLLEEVLQLHPVSFSMVVAPPSAHPRIFGGVGAPWDGTLPAAWLLDAQGRTLDFIVGPLDEAVLAERVVARVPR